MALKPHNSNKIITELLNRTTSDLIYSIAVPMPPNLVDETDLNIGEISSSGLELSLTYRALRTEKFYESHKEKWTIKDALKKYEDLLSIVR